MTESISSSSSHHCAKNKWLTLGMKLNNIPRFLLVIVVLRGSYFIKLIENFFLCYACFREIYCEVRKNRATKPKFLAQSIIYMFTNLTTCHATNVAMIEIHTKRICQSALCISSTHNNWVAQHGRFFCATSWSRKVKNINPKLAAKHCCATSWGLLNLVFRRVKVPRTLKFFFGRNTSF